MKKGFIPIILALFLVLVAVSTYYYVRTSKNVIPLNNEGAKDYKTFSSKNYKFTFNYPSKLEGGEDEKTNGMGAVIIWPYHMGGGGPYAFSAQKLIPGQVYDNCKECYQGYLESYELLYPGPNSYKEFSKLPIGTTRTVLNKPSRKITYKFLGKVTISGASGNQFEINDSFNGVERRIIVNFNNDLYLLSGVREDYDYSAGKEVSGNWDNYNYIISSFKFLTD